MPFAGFEPLLDDVLSTLRTNLPLAIAAVNSEHDDFDIAAPNDDEGDPTDAYVLAATAVTPFPYVEVASPDGLLHARTVGNVEIDSDATLSVRILNSAPGDASAQLYRRSMRYADAALRVLLQPKAFGDGVQLREEDSCRIAYRWGSLTVPPDGDDPPEIRGGVLLVFFLEGIEDVLEVFTP